MGIVINSCAIFNEEMAMNDAVLVFFGGSEQR